MDTGSLSLDITANYYFIYAYKIVTINRSDVFD